MEKKFAQIPVKELNDNVFHLLDDDWMLITAGDPGNFNTMTASWGALGILWHLPVSICFVRPHRYTFEFMEASEYYTLCFLEEQYRDMLQFCGTHSGKDVDKVAETGLVPLTTETGNIFYEQCKLVLECRKLYSDFLKEERVELQNLIDKNYPKKDFHKFYIGEIISCLIPV
jgi:flavin reductase (DIM6/NTAB) family NADH-FMN oxidoreductase RutF